jgi:hypothetical protein
VRALEGSEARVPTVGAIGVDQKAIAAEETPCTTLTDVIVYTN